jgi:outer membrane protein assembly factor BamB
VHGTTLTVVGLDGTLLALDVKTGAQQWARDLGAGFAPEAGNVFAPPTIAGDGSLFVGHRRKLVALDATRAGAERWTLDPIPDATYGQSLAAIAAAGDTIVGVFHRELGGVIAWDRVTGQQRWRLEGLLATAINASPVIAGDTVYVVNGLTEVIALDLATGAERWQVKLDPAGFDWGNATIGTPAIAQGILVVPTLYRDLVALDAATGHERWRFAGTPSSLRTTHYRGAREAGFEASPVIAGELVWAVDTAGRLTAIELASGRLVWEHELGVPALAGLAIAGDWLVAATYDGTVHALAPSTRPPFSDAAKRCDAVPRRGCCSAGGEDAALATVATALALRRRRRYAGRAGR